MRAILLGYITIIFLWPSLFQGEQVTVASSREADLDRVILQLPWTHAMRFAGYYLAKEKGFYQEAGFDVEIRELRPNVSSTELVISGDADFGVSSSVLVSYVHGMPVMVLAAVAQHSPFVLIAPERSGIRELRDFRGKKVMMPSTLMIDSAQVMLASAGISLGDVEFVPYTQDVDAFLNGYADACLAYVGSTSLELEKRGIPYVIFHPADFGADGSGEVLFTSRVRAIKNPGRVKAFRDASLKGWAFFANHTDEAIRLVAKYAPGTAPERLANDARIMAQLMTDEMVPIGYVNTERWIRNGKKLAQISQLPYVEEQSRNALFDEYLAARAKRWGRLLKFGLCSAFGLVILLGGFAMLLGRTMNRRASEFAEITNDRELNVKNLVENNIYAIAVIDEKGVLVFVNKLFETLSGYSTAEILSYPISFPELFGESQQERLATYIFTESNTSGSASTFDLDIICKSGKVVPIECAVRPILWHDKPCKYIVVRDISERIKSEQKLRDSEALFRTVAEGAFDGISLVDAAGVFLYVNEKLATTTQYTVAELVGAHYSEFMCPEDFRRIRLRFERRKAENQIYREFESRLTRRDGTMVPVLAATREIRLDDRQAFVIAYKDISVRKRMERELLQIAEWERIRIAQDLHDTVGQHISGMAYLMEVLSGKLKRDQSIHTDSSVELVEVARQAHQQLREVVKALLPLVGETKLAEALEHLCTNMRVLTRATFTLVDDGLGQIEFESMMAEHLRCIAQEASANAVRHGKAKNIVITLAHENGQGFLRIDDDGSGFDVDSERFSGSGLKIMNYRANIIEGVLSIKRREGGGMSVLCTFILPHAADGINHHAKV